MSKVKIQGNASGTGVITLTAPNTSTDRVITLPDEDVTLGAATPSIDDNGNATAITIDSDENVGIGDTTPNSGRLHVSNSSGTIGYFESTQASTNASNIVGNSTETSSSANLVLQINGGTTAQAVLRATGNNDTVLLNGATPAEKVRFLAGGGITFNGDTASANALDDYEEGTWTPTFSGSHIGSHTLNYATYTKIGRLVTVNCYVYNFGSIGGSGVSFGIQSLPFAQDYQATGTLGGSNYDINASYGWTVARGYNGTIYLEQLQDNGSSVWLDYGRVGANTHVQISLTYETNA